MALKFLLGLAALRGLWGAYMRRTPIYINNRLAALAYGDGINNDSPHLQQAMDDAKPGEVVQLGRGVLALSKPVTIHSNRNVHLHGLRLRRRGLWVKMQWR